MIEVADKCPRCGTRLKIQADPALRGPDRELYLGAEPDDLHCPTCGATLSLKAKLNVQVLADSWISPGTLVTYEQEQARIIAAKRNKLVVDLDHFRSSDPATQRQIIKDNAILEQQLDEEAYATARMQAQKIQKALADRDSEVQWIDLVINDVTYPLNIMHPEVSEVVLQTLELLTQLPLDFEEDD